MRDSDYVEEQFARRIARRRAMQEEYSDQKNHDSISSSWGAMRIAALMVATFAVCVVLALAATWLGWGRP